MLAFKQIVEAFARETPAAVLFRGLFARTFSADRMETIFREHKQRQVEGDLLFSKLIDLLTPVVLGKSKSVGASYRSVEKEIGVSRQAVYGKLRGVECSVSEALVRVPTKDLSEILQASKVRFKDIIRGYHAFIIDGKRLDGSEHRLAETRSISNASLPGTVIALLDTRTRLFVGIACSPDGHACERKVVEPILSNLRPGCLYFADRNFCDGPTLDFFFAAGAFFVIRQHQRSPVWHVVPGSRRKRIGRDSRGATIYEQPIEARLPDGTWKRVRRITVKTKTATQKGETELHFISNLPRRVSARAIADGYRGRWTIETCLQHLAQSMNAEIKTLAYPKAALLCFALALLAHNIVRTIAHLITKHARAAEQARDAKQVVPPLSSYYLALEIVDVHRGLEIITQHSTGWEQLAQLPLNKFCNWLRSVAKHGDVERYRTNVRGPKTPPPKRTQINNTTHVSTYKLIRHRCP